MKKRFLKIIKYIIYFIIFSIIGSLIEYLFGFIGGRGIAYDKGLYELFNVKIFFIPFYGLVSLSLILFNKILDKKKVKFFYRGLLNGILIVSWELVGALFSIAIFGHKLWDYSNHILNLNGMISLQMSFLWLIAGYIFALLYKYIIKKYELKNK